MGIIFGSLLLSPLSIEGMRKAIEEPARLAQLAKEKAERESGKQYYFDALAVVLKNELSVVDNELEGSGRWHSQPARWI